MTSDQPSDAEDRRVTRNQKRNQTQPPGPPPLPKKPAKDKGAASIIDIGEGSSGLSQADKSAEASLATARAAPDDPAPAPIPQNEEPDADVDMAEVLQLRDDHAAALERNALLEAELRALRQQETEAEAPLLVAAGAGDPGDGSGSGDSSDSENDNNGHDDFGDEDPATAPDSDGSDAEDRPQRPHRTFPVEIRGGRRHRSPRGRHPVEFDAPDDRPNKYTPKGRDPPKKLGNDPSLFVHWCFHMETKFRDDAPLFTKEIYKVDYALTQIEEPLWSNVVDWLENRQRRGKKVTYSAFLKEVCDFLDLKSLSAQARDTLNSIRLQPGEDVTGLYGRLTTLWRQAKTPLPDRLYQFRRALPFGIQRALNTFDDEDLPTPRAILRKARRVERNNRRTNAAFPDNRQPANRPANAAAGASGAARRPPSFTPRTIRVNANTFQECPPSLQQPASWVGGGWCPPERTPQPLQPSERRTFREAGRCYRCRGSGHRADNPICPNRPENRAQFWGGPTVAANSTAAPAPAQQTDAVDAAQAQAQPQGN